jgi:heme-degrading monooxygenase HmoA
MIITVFRSRLRDDGRADYFALAPKMSELARQMPGYLSHKVFTAEDGERVTVVEFKDIESQRAWATQMDHVDAKKQGREAFYAEYSVQVCEVLRESKFVLSDAR